MLARLMFKRCNGETLSLVIEPPRAPGPSVIEGNISISTTDLVANIVMPTLIQKLRQLYPDISIELISTDIMSDLKRREADIAIRSLQPGDQDLIARKIGDFTGHLYASEQYLQQTGVPRSAEDLVDANIICDKSEMIIKAGKRGFYKIVH